MRRSKLQIWGAALIFLAACQNKASPIEVNAENTEENVAEANAAEGEPEGNLIFCPVVDARVSQPDCDDLTKVDSQVQQGVGAFNVPNPMTRGHAKAITLVVDRRTPEEIKSIETQQEANATEAEAVSDNVEMDMNAVANEASADENAIAADANNVAAEPPPPPPQPPHPAAKPGPEAATPKQIVEPLEGKTETLTPKVGRFMTADLSGDGFNVQALSPASQEIPPGEQAEWQWNVTPTAGGTHTLTLKTIVEGVVGGKHYPLSRTQTIKSVQVKVSWGDKLADWFDAAIAWLNRMKLVLLAIAGVLGAGWAVRRAWKGKADKGNDG